VVRIGGSLLGEQFLCMSLRTVHSVCFGGGSLLTVVPKVTISTDMIFEHTRIPNAPYVSYLKAILMANLVQMTLVPNATGRPYVKQ
jgi:hypothetical protein